MWKLKLQAEELGGEVGGHALRVGLIPEMSKTWLLGRGMPGDWGQDLGLGSSDGGDAPEGVAV